MPLLRSYRYERKDFCDAFKRYLPEIGKDDGSLPSHLNRHNATTQRREGENADHRTATEDARGALKSARFPNGEKGCGTVADRNGRMPVEQVFLSAADDAIYLYPDAESEKKEHNR